MSKKESAAERRKFKRFQIKAGGYTVLRVTPTIIAQIVDMSMNGLAVRYKSKSKLLKKTIELDIISSNADFYLVNIQTDTISEYKISGKILSRSEKVWKRHMQFNNLSNKQISWITVFLNKFILMNKRSYNDRRQFNYSIFGEILTDSELERRKGIDRRKGIRFNYS